MSKPLDDKIQFRREIFLAFVITGLACAASFSNLLFTPSDLYPMTSDAMGHMAKVRYLADSLLRGEFPSWFPYWYNGSTVSQYYPPFSYWIMVPIFLVTQNVMVTFKINCFIMIFIGGIGVWYFCRIYIGKWSGIIGSIFFCIQPYIILTFFGAGLLAQGPVIALTPWYLIAILSYGYKPSPRKFLFCTLICALMILSHPMTIFMICLCSMVVFLIFVFLKKITFLNYIFILLSIIFAGLLTTFWSLVGVTGLETPGIPYLLVEAALAYTANIGWYTTLYSTFFYFAIPITVGCILAALLYTNKALKKKIDRDESYYILFCILLTFLTILFSFGLNLPLFQYLPMAESYVPGRILALTSVTGAILCSYLINGIRHSAKLKKTSIQVLALIVCTVLIGAALYYMNPIKVNHSTLSDKEFNNMFDNNINEGSNFEKGRYACIAPIDSSETYFPLSDNFNITIGWNIEGTPHNQALWSESVAQATGNLDYIAKELAFWNVRSIYLVENFDKVIEILSNKYSFELKATRDEKNFYVSSAPSSYFLTDERKALIFGKGSPGVAMEFPYLVYEQRNDISDYTVEELEKYKLIYLCEPEVDTIQDKKNIEDMVERLIEKGVTVVIEPTNANKFPLFGVTVSDVVLEGSPVIKKQSDNEIENTADVISVDEGIGYGRVLFGLDKVYYQLIQNDSRLKNDVIGTKEVGNKEVVFIGMHLTQNLKAVYARNFGAPKSNDDSYYPECSDEVKTLFTDIFKTYGVNTDFWPDSFPVKNANWNYKGVNFEYSSQKTQEMTLSVTYAPRWKATLDGKPMVVGQKENLITLDLPAGNHEVKLVYGLTKYGIAGYIISVVGLLIFILFIKFYDIILDNFRQICVKLSNFLQLVNKG